VTAALAAVVAAALTPPGSAVLDSIREAVGVKRAQPALFSLPAPGRLLALSRKGPWIVDADGSRRLLGAYREASWSPHGLYVAATRTNELLALDPKGNVRWSLARPEVRFPRWTGTRTDTRLVYSSHGRLRLVAGDGTGDRALCGGRRAAPVAPAWRPGPARILAYAGPRGQVIVLDADRCAVLGTFAPGAVPTQVSWSDDGRQLIVLSPAAVTIVDARGRLLRRQDPLDGTRALAATFVPGTHDVAELRAEGAQSAVYLRGRVLFRGAGRFGGLVWSPDRRWLLVTWPSADQWIFIGCTGVRQIAAVSDINRQFGGSFPRISGWCCG
jgi:hypothetical protein